MRIDRQTYERSLLFMALVVEGGSAQFTMDGNVYKVLMDRSREAEEVDVCFSLALACWRTGCQPADRTRITEFILQLPWSPKREALEKGFLAVEEMDLSMMDVLGHLDDGMHLKEKSEGDPLYALAAANILSGLGSAEYGDFMEYLRVYGIPDDFQWVSDAVGIFNNF